MTTTRACVTCGQLFEVNPRTPRRRYCTPRCRAEDWRRRHRPTASPNAANEVRNGDTVTNAANDDPRTNDVQRTNDAANDDRRATLSRCPHCRRPIAVLTLLVPPTAAHVTAPQAHHG